MKATKRSVERWLLELMGRQAPQSVADAKRNAETATPAFVVRFDAAAFCQASQDAIAGGVRYWNEAAVSTALEVWCKENLGTSGAPALPAEAEAAPLSLPGKHLYAGFLTAEDDRSAARRLALMQAVDPATFRWVTDHDLRAADIVVLQGWQLPPDAEDLRAEWDDETAVRTKASALMDLHREMAGRQAPQQAGLGTFKNWQAVVWTWSLDALTAAVATNAREHLPALQDELQYRSVTVEPRRSRLFGS